MRNFLKGGIPHLQAKKETSSSSSDEDEVVIKDIKVESPKEKKGNTFLKALQAKKTQNLENGGVGGLTATASTDTNVIPVDLTVVSNIFRRGGLLHASMKQMQGDGQLNYDKILSKNVIDIAQVEDAEACIIALRKINKKSEEVDFLIKALKNLGIFKGDADKNKADLSQVFDNP